MTDGEQRAADQRLVDELLGIDEGLTDWEVEFAEDLADWLEENETLTRRQRAKAEQILEDTP